MARLFKPVQSGELRHVGNLEQLVKGVDAAGGPTTQYTLFASNVRFSISDWKVNESNQSGQIVSQVITYIALRWRPGMTGLAPNTMRLVHTVDYSASPHVIDYYDIQGVVRERTTRVAIQLACIKRDAAGFRIGTVP